jgi:alpha-beta hydrolase superfamily lysophospholipase
MRKGERFTVSTGNVVALLVGVLVCYLLLAIAVYLLQDRLLYFPGIASRSHIKATAAQEGLELWPVDGNDFYGHVSALSPSATKGTVLVWHGNAASALYRIYYVRALQRLGFHVVLLEYPGFGSRPGDLGESSFVSDAKRATRLAVETFGGPLYVWGESLGCGVASAIAADTALQVRGAVMLTPWDTLPEVAQHKFWYLPARWLTRDQYDNVRNLRGFDGPVAVIMADRDRVIPNAHTLRLYESLPGEKRLWVFEHAGHNTWPTAPDAAWWAEVMEFIAGSTM